MASGTFSVMGMASGLPADIVDQLVNAQKTRLKSMERDKTFFTGQQTAIGELETKMLALETKAKDLESASAWSPHTVSTSDDNRIVATADSSAQAAIHSIAVGQLATYDTTVTTSGVSSQTATLGANANFTFSYNGTTYGTSATTQTTGFDSASLQDKTLEDLASAINNIDYGQEAGVSASVLYDGTQYRLVLSAKDSGTYNNGDRIAIDGNTSFSTSDGASFDSTSFTKPNGSPQDAILKIDGINVTSSSNQVTTALTGVTLNLKTTTSGTTVTDTNGDGIPDAVDTTGSPVNITIANDTTSLKTILNGFVDAYNAVVDYYYQHKGDTLSGDTTARSVLSQMRNVLNTQTQSSTGTLAPFSTLAEMGLRTDQKSGKISFDSTSLDQALSADFNSVTRLFTSKHSSTSDTFNEGLAYRMTDLIKSLTSSTGGSVTGRKDGLKARIDRLDKSIERENSRLDQVRESLTKKFSNLEQMISKMNSSSSSAISSIQKLNGN
ncbi:MAG: flagellar filament capping protein FliD [Magnetococcales bacterium]|nr:flagellar filament capping protein FliD [Magnetococcales bacterium]